MTDAIGKPTLDEEREIDIQMVAQSIVTSMGSVWARESPVYQAAARLLGEGER